MLRLIVNCPFQTSTSSDVFTATTRLGPRCCWTHQRRKFGIINELRLDTVRFPESEHAWLETLVVRVTQWENGTTNEKVVFISTTALLASAKDYDVGGVDATYNVSPRQSCVLVFGTYHDRAFMPIALGISSSKTPGAPIRKGFGSCGETTRHYESFLGTVAELCTDFHPKYFIRDAARQIHNAIETLWPGVIQCSCWFHTEQCVERWFNSDDGKEFRKDLKQMHKDLNAIHYAKHGEASLGLELLQRSYKNEAFWSYMHNANRMPGQVQSAWTRELFADGAPVTACGLECMNKPRVTRF